MSATPGPWKLHGELGEIVDDSGEYLIARVSQLYSSGKANACLMAAAPDLLEALQDTICHVCNNRIGWIRTGWFTGRTCIGCDKARAAIATATGEAATS